MKYLSITLIIFAFIFSCKNNEKLAPYLESSNSDSLIIGYNNVKYGDTQFIKKIFDSAYDGRETFILDYKGQTVYQAKMNAIQRISGIKPPKKITYKPDTTIVEFYRNWAKEKGYID